MNPYDRDDSQADRALSDLRMTIVMEGFGCDMDPRL